MNTFNMYIHLLSIVFNLGWIFFTQLCYYYFFNNNKRKNIQIIANRLSSVNILYVKLFQALCLNKNLISDDINHQLLQFTDNVPWDNTDIDYDTIWKVCDELKELNLTLDIHNPIKSGMISLIYHVKDQTNGKQFILKIKRKNIEHKLQLAFDDVLTIIKMLSHIPFINRFNIQQSIVDSHTMILSQCNFQTEVSNIITFKNNCKNLDYVVIPNVNELITIKNPNVILMEYINGETLQNIDPKHYKFYAPLVVKFGIVTSFFHGITHGDLHMGNILFIHNDGLYKIGVLDFGIVYKLKPTIKEAMFNIISEYDTIEPSKIAEQILLSGMIDSPEIINNLPNNKYQDLLDMVTEIMSEFFSKTKKANQLMIYKFLDKLHSFLKSDDITEFNIKPSSDFIESQISIAMAQGVTNHLIQEQDITDYFDSIIAELLHLDLFAND